MFLRSGPQEYVYRFRRGQDFSYHSCGSPRAVRDRLKAEMGWPGQHGVFSFRVARG